jgi:nucleoside 2-deoxyribosyltransferase
MMNVYLAGPLFTLAEQTFNLELARNIENIDSKLTLVLPQLKNKELQKSEHVTHDIFNYCVEMVNQCHLLVAILDGADADSGTCIEMGLAYAQGKPIIGVRTDFRSLEDRGLNLMVSFACSRLIWQSMETVDDLAKEIVKAIKDVTAI